LPYCRKRKRDYLFTNSLPLTKNDCFDFTNSLTFENLKLTRDIDSIQLSEKYLEERIKIFKEVSEYKIIKRLQVGMVKMVRHLYLGELLPQEYGYYKDSIATFIINTSIKRRRHCSLDGYYISQAFETLTFSPNNLPPLKNNIWYVKKWLNMDIGFKAVITDCSLTWNETTFAVTISFQYHTSNFDDEINEWIIA